MPFSYFSNTILFQISSRRVRKQGSTKPRKIWTKPKYQAEIVILLLLGKAVEVLQNYTEANGKSNNSLIRHI